MPAIISEQFRILNAETFVKSFVGVGSTVNKYYAFLGLPNSIEPTAVGIGKLCSVIIVGP